MLKKFASLSFLILILALPTTAHAQLDNWQGEEAASAILDAGWTAAQIRELRQVPSVGVFNISFGVSPRYSGLGGQANRLEIFAERNSRGVGRLRHALAANPITRNTMLAHNVNVNHVLGVSVGATGSLRFFVD